MPESRCSPVSWLISTRRLASSFAILRMTSMSFGRSAIRFGSMATVTTGSETCRISSNGAIPASAAIVVPAKASESPITAAMLPAVTSSTISRSGPMNSDTCWIRFLVFVPTTLSSIPFWSRPEKTRPVAISPALGSMVMSVTMNAAGPSASVATIAFPTADSVSPFQMFGIRYLWATRGLGRCRTTMSKMTSLILARWAISFERPVETKSMMSGNLTPVRCMYGTLIAQFS